MGLLGRGIGLPQGKGRLSLPDVLRDLPVFFLILPVGHYGPVPPPVGQDGAVILDLILPNGYSDHRLATDSQTLPGRHEHQGLPRELEDVVTAPRQAGQQAKVGLIGLVQVG